MEPPALTIFKQTLRNDPFTRNAVKEITLAALSSDDLKLTKQRSVNHLINIAVSLLWKLGFRVNEDGVIDKSEVFPATKMSIENFITEKRLERRNFMLSHCLPIDSDDESDNED